MLLHLLLLGSSWTLATAWQRSSPASAFSHNFGYAVGSEAWAISASDSQNFGIHGNYATDIPTSTAFCAHFYLSMSDVTSDGLGVAKLELANGGSPLNHKWLLRSEFLAADTMQAFRVCATSPSSGVNVEARLWTPGEQGNVAFLALAMTRSDVPPTRRSDLL